MAGPREAHVRIQLLRN